VFRASLAVLAAALLCASAAPAGVTGGSAAERAAIARILGRMPGTRVTEVRILAAPPGAPSSTRTLGVVVGARKGDPPLDRRALQARAGWEAEIVAGAIRDGFARRGLSRVAAFIAVTSPAQISPRFYRPLGRPGWNLGRWEVRDGIRSAGKARDGRWGALRALLRADARRFGLRLRMEPYNPFGKAPVVTVTTRSAQAFLRSRALAHLRADLGIGGRRFDGAFLSVVGGGRTFFTAFSTHRTAVTAGCAVYVRSLAGRACRTS
jgi:hypothetical protein